MRTAASTQNSKRLSGHLAVENACRMTAWEEAIQSARQALALMPTVKRQIQLAQVLFWHGQFDEARKCLQAVLMQGDSGEAAQEHAYATQLLQAMDQDFSQS